MSRHNVFLQLSRPQAEYLLDAIDADLEHGELDAEEAERAARTRAKVDRALTRVESRVNCDENCRCRKPRATRPTQGEPA